MLTLEDKQDLINDLYLKYKNRTFGLVGRYVYDYDERQEVVQEVYLRLFKSLDRFKNECKISTWLYKLTQNVCLNYIREKKFYKNKHINVEILSDFNYVKDYNVENKLYNSFYAQEKIRQIKKFVNKLKIRDSIKFNCLFLFAEGFSYGEIAQKLGIKENTVRSRISRSRDMLKEEFYV